MHSVKSVLFQVSSRSYINTEINSSEKIFGGVISPGYQTVAGTIVSWRSRVQTDRTDKCLYQSIQSDKDFTIDRRFPYWPSPTPMTFVSLRLMDNYQRPGRSSITIPETFGPLIGDFIFSRASVENCFQCPVCVLFREKKHDYFFFKVRSSCNKFLYFIRNFRIKRMCL